jgi:hypothetical protein
MHVRTNHTSKIKHTYFRMFRPAVNVTEFENSKPTLKVSYFNIDAHNTVA